MKKRIDVLLAERGFTKSREKAKALVIAGEVRVSDVQVKHPSDTFEEDVVIEVGKDNCPYVSRGGLKLEKAVQEFGIVLQEKICMDIGASTGGFTDCMLKNGASYVYAVDVGYGQFDWTLRNDKRVKLMERTNARYLEKQDKPVDFVSVDVSFISLKLIFPAIARISAEYTEIVTLIKPQFEAGREHVGKKGVVKDQNVHQEVIKNTIQYALDHNFFLQGLTYSPIKGPNGNIEYLAYFSTEQSLQDLDVSETVAKAHMQLN